MFSVQRAVTFEAIDWSKINLNFILFMQQRALWPHLLYLQRQNKCNQLCVHLLDLGSGTLDLLSNNKWYCVPTLIFFFLTHQQRLKNLRRLVRLHTENLCLTSLKNLEAKFMWGNHKQVIWKAKWNSDIYRLVVFYAAINAWWAIKKLSRISSVKCGTKMETQSLI